MYKRGIREALARRLDHVFQRYLEAGLYDRYNGDPVAHLRSLVDPEKALLCLQRFVPVDRSTAAYSQQVDVVRMASYGSVLPLLAACLAVSLVIVITRDLLLQPALQRLRQLRSTAFRLRRFFM